LQILLVIKAQMGHSQHLFPKKFNMLYILTQKNQNSKEFDKIF